MANLSQQKRERMLAFLETLKEQHSDDESLIAIGEIEKELKSKKYGLVWEEHEEAVDVQMKTQIPVFTEVKEREICADEGGAYNFLLEGDNLHSLYLLEKTHKGKIDVIYIDPPYNTGNQDFIYDDRYVSKEDGFRHSVWCSFIDKRLKIARKLLSDKGVIFISIDDNELSALRMLCDDIFGFENYEATITYVRKTSGKQDSSNFVTSTEYILVYSKKSEWKCATLIAEQKVTDRYNKTDKDGRKYRETDLRKTGNADRREDRPLMYYPFYYNSKTEDLIAVQEPDSSFLENGYVEILPIKPDNTEGRWRWGLKTAQENLSNLVARIMPKYKSEKKYTIYEKDYIDKKEEVRTVKEHTCWDRKEFNSDNAMQEFKNLGFNNQKFTFPKSPDLIKHILYLANCRNGLILDFFAGSGTTGQAVMKLNAEDGGHRKFILCTNNENNICEEITYQRLKTVITGKRADGSEYSEGIPANLKYFRTDFVDKDSEELSDELLEHIAEMIELEHGIKIDNKKYVMIMTEEEMDEFERNIASYTELKAVFVNQDILLSSKQQKLLDGLSSYVIPDYYFDFELREAGELW